VKVFFADKQKVLSELRDYAANLKRTHPEVVRIGLFGSYATDTYGPASDADLLIVLRDSSKRFLDRSPDLIPDKLSIDCDVFAYTEREIERMKEENSPWLAHVLQQVIWL
jgi:predicted nucleotidyltransferase